MLIGCGFLFVCLFFSFKFYLVFRFLAYKLSIFVLGVEASTYLSEDDKEMKMVMEEMDNELAQTSIGESFEKVSLLLIPSLTHCDQ